MYTHACTHTRAHALDFRIYFDLTLALLRTIVGKSGVPTDGRDARLVLYALRDFLYS